MHVARSTLRQALFQVYRTSVGTEVEVVTKRDLEDEWSRTGLRQSDFTAALNEMTRRKLVVVVDHGPDQWIELTSAGFREYRQSGNGWIRALWDWLILKRASMRKAEQRETQLRLRRRRIGELMNLRKPHELSE